MKPKQLFLEVLENRQVCAADWGLSIATIYPDTSSNGETRATALFTEIANRVGPSAEALDTVESRVAPRQESVAPSRPTGRKRPTTLVGEGEGEPSISTPQPVPSPPMTTTQVATNPSLPAAPLPAETAHHATTVPFEAKAEQKGNLTPLSTPRDLQTVRAANATRSTEVPWGSARGMDPYATMEWLPTSSSRPESVSGTQSHVAFVGLAMSDQREPSSLLFRSSERSVSTFPSIRDASPSARPMADLDNRLSSLTRAKSVPEGMIFLESDRIATSKPVADRIDSYASQSPIVLLSFLEVSNPISDWFEAAHEVDWQSVETGRESLEHGIGQRSMIATLSTLALVWAYCTNKPNYFAILKRPAWGYRNRILEPKDK
jgi:hypothetical protein